MQSRRTCRAGEASVVWIILGVFVVMGIGVAGMFIASLHYSGKAREKSAALVELEKKMEERKAAYEADMLVIYQENRAESQKVGVYLYTIPPMTAALAYLFRNESLGVEFVVGSLFVLCGVWLTESG